MRAARANQAEALEQVREEQRARRAAFATAQAEARQERSEGARAQLQARAQAHIENLFGVFTERLRAAIARLTTLANRIDTRIAAAEEETGERMTIAREELDEARRLLIQAGEDVEAATMTMREVLASDQPRERFSEVREALTIARETLKEAQLALLSAVRAVQAALSE